jgi:hypothetical protein
MPTARLSDLTAERLRQVLSYDPESGVFLWLSLRPATRPENMNNRARMVDNHSGYKGVYWHRAAGRYSAEITIGGRRTYLGLFDTTTDASAAYESAARLHHKEFARI